MSAELFILLIVTFKQYNRVYVWSILITIIGVILYTTAILFVNFENNASPVAIVTILNTGVVASLLGYLLVLWSRLHLVIGHKPRLLKGILVLVIFSSLTSAAITFAIGYGLDYRHPKSFYVRKLVHSIQGFVFAAQETIISGVYIYQTARFLKSGYAFRVRKIVGTLVIIQFVCIGLNAGFIVISYTKGVRLAAVFQPMEITIKLRLEFVVLNQLKSLVKGGLNSSLRLTSVALPQELDIEKRSNSYPTDEGLLSCPIQSIRGTDHPISAPHADSEITSLRKSNFNHTVRADQEIDCISQIK
jgi:MFS family permease